jgi:hypothetical protein
MYQINKPMTTQIKRRYTESQPEYHFYDSWFDRFLMQSSILNTDPMPNSQMQFMDKPAILHSIVELLGDENGMFWQGNTRTLAIIPQAEAKLKEVEIQWIVFQDMREAEGYLRPEVEPASFLEKRCKTQAFVDVKKRELEFLQKKLSEIKEKVEAEQTENMLAYGTLGNSQIRNGELNYIDQQKVSRINNVFVITEKSSPYYLMKVIDYRAMAEKWCAEQHAKRRKLDKEFNREYLATGHSNIERLTGLGIHKVSKEMLPKWPEGVEPYNGEDKKDK